jgi:hypothetical protein
MTERHHAYLVCSYYVALKTRFGEKGIETFVEATKRYGEQRGRRMALRAAQHGFAKDYLGYFTHGEWVPTSPDNFAVEETTTDDGDLHTKVYACPWHAQFKEMGMLECGAVYCQHIDKSLVRGFNPDLVLDLTGVLHTSDYCNFYWRGANFNEERAEIIARARAEYGEENIRSFEYHVGHVYRTFSEQVMQDLGPDEGAAVVAVVEKDFALAYGTDALNEVLKFSETDFDVIS